jgi:iron complex outermembrane receptor protein
MRFRDEIAPIGALSVTGSQLRRNVARSARTGIEFEGAWRARPSLLLTANAMLMRARIAEYTDEEAAVTYTDVPPLLSPAVLANAQAAWTPRPRSALTLSLRHVGESHLANDGNPSLVTPAYTLADLGASQGFGRTTLRLQVQNLLDVTAYASGYTDGTTRYFFPVAARTLLATVAVTF